MLPRLLNLSVNVFIQADTYVFFIAGLSRDGPNILSNPGAEEGNSPWQFERRPPNDARIEFRNNGKEVYNYM